MKKLLCCLFIIPILHSSVQAADKIRIGFSELIASYSSLPLAQKRGFLQEEGLQAEFIRMNTTVGLTTF
jgi:ABC-type nitrate/sulfonate/bicarbonate transport system substrate-binding protein